MNTAHLAGRFVLAVADDDTAQTLAILREAIQHNAILPLLTEVATLAIHTAREHSGDDWRSVLTTALHALELDQL